MYTILSVAMLPKHNYMLMMVVLLLCSTLVKVKINKSYMYHVFIGLHRFSHTYSTVEVNSVFHNTDKTGKSYKIQGIA